METDWQTKARQAGRAGVPLGREGRGRGGEHEGRSRAVCSVTNPGSVKSPAGDWDWTLPLSGVRGGPVGSLLWILGIIQAGTRGARL